jgi:DeoR family transcriptional regulator, fructose operon transcriptional repressor
VRGKLVNATDRRLKIFNIIFQEKSVNVIDLSKMFDVTPMTIRRDLSLLEKQGILTTNYGGAIFNSGTAIEPSFSLKSSQMIEGKKKIGEAITHLIKNGDSIFFDCGTTVEQVAKNLPDVKITAITNSLSVCNVLKAYPNVKLITIGGNYDEISDGFTGTNVIQSLSKLNIDKAIVGTQGFDIKRGSTVPDEDDAALKKAIIDSSKVRILAVGHEKIGINYLVKFAELSDYNYIVTDKAFDKDSIDLLNASGIKLIVAEQFCTIASDGKKKFPF